MASENEIRIIVKAEVEKAKKDLASVSAQAKNTGEGLAAAGQAGAQGLAQMGGQTGILGSVIGKLPGPLKFAAVGIGAVVGAVAGFIAVGTKFADIASEQEQALTKLGAISKATGNNFDTTKAAAQELASDGLMSFKEASSALSNLLATGMNLPKAIELLKIAKDNAVTNRQANYDLGESVVVFTEGIKNENSMLTDSVGIQKNYSKILDEGAKAIGRTVESLSAREKAQIVANGFIKEGAAFEGQAAKAKDTYAGAAARAKAATQEMSIEIGKTFMPAMTAVKGIFASAAESATNFFRKLNQGGETVAEAARDDVRVARAKAELATNEKKLYELQQKTQAGRTDKQQAQILELQNTIAQNKADLKALEITEGLNKALITEAELKAKIIAKGGTPTVTEAPKPTGPLARAAARLAETTPRPVFDESVGQLEKEKALEEWRTANAGAIRAREALIYTEKKRQVAELEAQLDSLISKEETEAKLNTESSALIVEANKNNIAASDELIKKAIQLGLIDSTKGAKYVTEKRKEISANAEMRAALELEVQKKEEQARAQDEYEKTLAKVVILEKEMAAVGITLSEQDKKSTETMKDKISEYNKYGERRKQLQDEALRLGILTETQITNMTNAEIEKRIKAYQKFKMVFSGVMAGIGEISKALFDFDKQLRDEKLAKDIAAIDETRDAAVLAAETRMNAEIAAADKSNAYTAEIDAMEAAHNAEAQALRDQELMDEKARLEAELAATRDTDEQKRLSADLLAVNRQIAEESYQKNLAALKEKEKIKNEQIEAAKVEAKRIADAARTQAETEHQDAVRELKRKAFDQEKTAKTAQALMGAALAIVQGFAQLGPIGGAIAAVTTGIATAVQVAAIQDQKFPEYRIGSEYIPRDQMAILHEGERVLTKEENRNFVENNNQKSFQINVYANDPMDMVNKIRRHYGDAIFQ